MTAPRTQQLKATIHKDFVAEEGGYIAVAKFYGGQWFELPPGMWENLAAQGQEELVWQIQERALQRQMEAGARIDFVTGHVDDILANPDIVGREQRKVIEFIEMNLTKYGYQRDPANPHSWAKIP
jgi:hypothetical protein